MRILFDQGVPVPLRGFLTHHEVSTAQERGWSRLANGELLDLAEREGYEVFVTTDKNLRHQQDVAARHLGFVVLGTTSWPRIRTSIDGVVKAINNATAESYVEVEVP